MDICLTSGMFDLSEKLSREAIYYRTFLLLILHWLPAIGHSLKQNIRVEIKQCFTCIEFD